MLLLNYWRESLILALIIGCLGIWHFRQPCSVQPGTSTVTDSKATHKNETETTTTERTITTVKSPDGTETTTVKEIIKEAKEKNQSTDETIVRTKNDLSKYQISVNYRQNWFDDQSINRQHLDFDVGYRIGNAPLFITGGINPYTKEISTGLRLDL